MRAYALALAVLCAGCAATPSRAPAPQVELTRAIGERAPDEALQRAACLRPAARPGCTDGDELALGRAGFVRCQTGVPVGSFASGETGRLGQPVWEALWRVLDLSAGCATVAGAPVAVLRGGRTAAASCAGGRVAIDPLIDGVKRSIRSGPQQPRPGACARSPEDCLSACVQGKGCAGLLDRCPRFDGDAWSPAPIADDPARAP